MSPPKKPNLERPPVAAKVAGPARARGIPLWSLLFIAAIIFIGVVVMYARQASVLVFAIYASDGVPALLWFFAAAMLGATVLPVFRLPVTGTLRIVTSAALGLGIFSLILLALGLAGWLNMWTTWALPIVSILLALPPLLRWAMRLEPASIADFFKQPVASHALWLITVPFIAVASLGAALPPWYLWKPGDPHPYDVLEYHLQVPREWYELGRIVPLHHNVFSYFPFNVEMHFLAAMELRGGPWAGMYTAQFMHLGFMALAVLAIYGVGRMLKPTGPGPILAAVAAATVPWFPMLAAVCYIEGGMLLWGTLAVGLALWPGKTPAEKMRGNPRRTLRRFGVRGEEYRRADGSARHTGGDGVERAILVFSLPWYSGEGRVEAELGSTPARTNEAKQPPPRPFPGVPGEGNKRVATGVLGEFRRALIFGVVGLLAFSPWLVRNEVWARNPIFPLAMKTLGQAHFTDIQVARFERAHQARPDQQSPGARLAAFWQQNIASWQYGYALWPLALVAAALAIRRRETIFLLLMLLMIAIFWIAFTHLKPRFFIFAVPLAALLIAQLDRKPLLIAAALVLAVFAATNWLGGDSLSAPSDNLSVRLSKGLGEKNSQFGLDFRDVLGELLQNKYQPGMHVYLDGDARAFMYALPESDLTYQTIFDLPGHIPALPDPLPRPPAPPPNPNALIVHDYAELRRFNDTYESSQPPTTEHANLPRTVEPVKMPPR